MAKNDKVLIDGIIDDRIESKFPSDKRDEVFEHFAFEQILKNYDLSGDDIQSGNVDGENDGGIDGAFIFVNGHLLTDPKTFSWPKSGSELEVWIISCKHHDTFRQAPLDNLMASLGELLDFAIDSPNLKGAYSDPILRVRENFKLAYRKVSPRLVKFSLNFCYASRGNSLELGEPIKARARQIETLSSDLFGNCVPRFNFFGATQLVELSRKIPNFSLELPFIENLTKGDTHILLVSLSDYYKFITDDGKLRRYLFDSNVRDFMGLNRVNEDIKSTLAELASPDFWWLNNGVTILSTSAPIIGKSIQIQDIQIVNGLQTSESIYRHFSKGGTDPMNRSILVKVIVSNDFKVRDNIIRATNNQTSVEVASLHATDRIQRDIEDILKQRDFYYERRINFYLNQGFPASKIVTPLYVAAGYICLVLKSPHQATVVKSRFMRKENSYNRVFSASADINVWPVIAYILKTTDSFLETVRPNGQNGSERFLKTKRQMLAFLTVSRMFKTYNFTMTALCSFDFHGYAEELSATWEFIKSSGVEINARSPFKTSQYKAIFGKAAETWAIADIGKIEGINSDEFGRGRRRHHKKNTPVTMEFAMQVNMMLPPQPWKPGIRREIMNKLDCTSAEFNGALKLLIDEGLRNEQKQGIVYDVEGNVIAFDKDRVDSEILKKAKNFLD